MNLIFNDYIEFLKYNGCKYDLKENYYWLDRQIIKAYDKNGILHKILRVYTDNKLKISFKIYKKENFEIESWEETLERKKDKLLELEKESIKLIKEKMLEYKDYEPIIFTSGGKDSNIVTYLVRSIKNTKALFNNTSLDCADTYKYIKYVENIKILNPKKGFYQWRKEKNFIPTRFARACCSVFKEGITLKYLNNDKKYLIFMGMRKSESSHRKKYTSEWKNKKWGDRPWQTILPILEYSEEDVWLYIIWKNIHINEKYKKGYKRVGCAIACPFYNKSTWVLDKYWYTSMYNRWQKILKEDFIKNKKWTRLNCTLEEYMYSWNGGLVRENPNKEVINEFCEYNNLNKNIGKKYFNNKCSLNGCNKNVNNHEIIAMNLKFHGRNTNTVYCKKHLKEELNINNKEWNKYVKQFKNNDCELF